MQRITLKVDEKVLEAARERACAENTTLNEQFRRWLTEYVDEYERLKSYEKFMDVLREDCG
ncbi:MAG: hypothetical protein HYV27_19660 [Candidatus Hydrogenedentes bacterium]|nr:hypothetical protein [Candidatus Hydrogenedentota bacterium]